MFFKVFQLCANFPSVQKEIIAQKSDRASSVQCFYSILWCKKKFIVYVNIIKIGKEII